MRRHGAWLGAALLVLSLAPALQAQPGSPRERREARRERMLEAPAPLQQGEQSPAERQRAERALRTALARTVRDRLNLTDQQAARLAEVNGRFAGERLQLAREEMRIRRELRLSIAAGDTSRSGATARLLDSLLEIQRQHLDLQQREQGALSEFLTPEQRARYIGMMEQLRRRIQVRADSARRMRDPLD